VVFLAAAFSTCELIDFLLVLSSEAAEASNKLWCGIFVIEKASALIAFMISIAKVPNPLGQLIFDVLVLFRRVHIFLCVEFPLLRVSLESIRLSSFSAHVSDSIDPSFHISPFKIVHTKREFHHTCDLVDRLIAKIFEANNMDGIESILDTIFEEDVKIFAH